MERKKFSRAVFTTHTPSVLSCGSETAKISNNNSSNNCSNSSNSKNRGGQIM